MKIAVCDDNLIFLDEMRAILLKHKTIEKVETFSSPLELLMQVTKAKDYDLVFMDLDWKNELKTGFQWGEELYQIIPDLPIIFITGYNDCFAQQVLLAKANILGYMTKPIDFSILDRYLEKARNNMGAQEYLVISRQSGRMSILMDDIIHIESHNHKAYIFTEREHFVVYEKLSELKDRLSKRFIQCHKSFVVNLEWIRSFEGKHFQMRSGKEIPISRTYGKFAKRDFFEYLGEE